MAGEEGPLKAVVVQADRPLAELGDTPAAQIDAAVRFKVAVFGRSTCPFCIEVTRTLAELGVPFGYWRLDQEEGGAAVLEELKRSTGQRTVPYVFINGKLVGGCDDTKALIASGDFDKLVGSTGAPEEAGGRLGWVRHAGVDEGTPKVIGALFEFPNTVDNRVIRLVALQVFFVALFIAIFSYQELRQWQWVSVGLLTDFCLRFYAGAGISPLGSIAQFAAALMDLLLPRLGVKTGPIWGAGPPKQFAVSVGILFSAIVVVMQFTAQWQAATAFAAALCFFAGLEAYLNFCAGCWVFGKAIKFHILPDTVYMVHINTLSETKHHWAEWTKRVHLPKPVRTVEPFPQHAGRTKVDLAYKRGKIGDWELSDFDWIRHSKIGFFSSVIGVAAVAAMFRFASLTPRYMLPDLVWQITALLSLVYLSIFLFPYLLKIALYPHKVWSETMHPVMSNAFSVPFMLLVVYAFLADGYSHTLAKVLFWIGAGPLLLIAVGVVGEWISRLRHDGHVNGSWQMAPVGCFIVAVMGPILDPAYRQLCFLWFAFGFLFWITLFIFTFQKFVLGHNQDPRQRLFAAIWMAAPAVGSIAWTVIRDRAPGDANIFEMDTTAQVLFYMALVVGLVLVWMAWRHFLWTDRFFMNCWAIGFPTAGLAWAAILYDATVQTAATKVLATSLMALACIVCVTLVFRTLTGIARFKVFIPEPRWGPMSHLPLAQDAMRELLDGACAAAEGLAADPSNARLAARLEGLWESFATVNTYYTQLKLNICFPQIGCFFPRHQGHAVEEHQAMQAEQDRVGALVAGVSKAGAASTAAEAVGPDDIDAYPGGCLPDQLQAALKQNRLLVVGRSTCPFCIEVTRTLGDLGLGFAYIKVDAIARGADLHALLKEQTGQKTVPYVYLNGRLLGGCDATKALIASGEFDKLLGTPGATADAPADAPANGSKGGAAAAVRDAAALRDAVLAFASQARATFDDMEDNIRPVMRRYVSGPVQVKIMRDCWDHAEAMGGDPGLWFLVLPLVVQHLPSLGERATYLRSFLWAMPERAQQIGVMVALGTDPVTWYRLRKVLPDITPRGEAGWRHY